MVPIDVIIAVVTQEKVMLVLDAVADVVVVGPITFLATVDFTLLPLNFPSATKTISHRISPNKRAIKRISKSKE